MNKLLFACYDKTHLGLLLPIFPILQEKGYELSLLNKFNKRIPKNELKGITIFDSPDINLRKIKKQPLPHELIESLNSIFEEEQTEYLVKNIYFIHQNPYESLRYLSYSINYKNFAYEVIENYNPDLIISSHSGIEARIVSRLCEKLNKQVIYWLPPFYEYKSIEPFEALNFKSKYIVSSEFGKQMLLKQAVPTENIFVIGNPLFLPYLYKKKHTEVKNILYTMQDKKENIMLFKLLKTYIKNRKNVRLLLRCHPLTGLRSYLAFFLKGLNLKIKISTKNKELKDLLQSADVLVTISSLTTLEALVSEVPVVHFKVNFFPDEVPFSINGDVLTAHNYKELENALDKFLFNTNFREEWVTDHKDCHKKYISTEENRSNNQIVKLIEKTIREQSCLLSSVV